MSTFLSVLFTCCGSSYSTHIPTAEREQAEAAFEEHHASVCTAGGVESVPGRVEAVTLDS
jgi:hypothetical protein